MIMVNNAVTRVTLTEPTSVSANRSRSKILAKPLNAYAAGRNRGLFDMTLDGGPTDRSSTYISGNRSQVMTISLVMAY